MQIVGTRPQVSPEQAIDAIATKFGIFKDEQLEIHPAAAPYDFFVLLLEHASYLTVLNGDRTVHTTAFQLAIKPWTRLAGAKYGALYHKVLIDLEGIPLHAWSYITAAALLHPYCSIASVRLETLSRADLSAFRLTAWTTRPERIPDELPLVVPERLDDALGTYRPTLKYMVQIKVRWLLMRMPPDSPPPSLPPSPPSEPSSDDDSLPHHPKISRRCHDR